MPKTFGDAKREVMDELMELHRGAPIAPVLLNEQLAAEYIGVSVRKFHALRSEPWFPQAIELGPRCLRWHRDELLAGITKDAPRCAVKPEPHQLVGSRK
jgi:predicted DNA-binding transcriptional regulator AlpA